MGDFSNFEIEEWRTAIKGESYTVSNLGRVKGKVGGPRNRKSRILRFQFDKDGYARLSLHIGGKYKRFGIHQLVTRAFLGVSDLHVNHINGDKLDNRLSNLEYCTNLENIRHSIEIGIRKTSLENHYNATLTNTQALDIHKRIESGDRTCDIAKDYNLTASMISRIKHGKAWRLSDLKK